MSPGGLQVRPAREQDLASICDIDSRVYRRQGQEHRFAKKLIDEGDQLGRVLVVVVASQVCGFLVYQLVLDCANILDVAVHPASRRRGLATALMKAAMGEMRSRGAVRCELEVRASNAQAIALYEDFEFSRDGIRADYYPCAQGREDALLMSLEF